MIDYLPNFFPFLYVCQIGWVIFRCAGRPLVKLLSLEFRVLKGESHNEIQWGNFNENRGRKYLYLGMVSKMSDLFFFLVFSYFYLFPLRSLDCSLLDYQTMGIEKIILHDN